MCCVVLLLYLCLCNVVVDVCCVFCLCVACLGLMVSLVVSSCGGQCVLFPVLCVFAVVIVGGVVVRLFVV